MNATARTSVVLLAVALAAAVTGCAKPAARTSAPATTSAETTRPADATAAIVATTAIPGASRGAITHPKEGSAERTAILDAARAALGIHDRFTVIQLYVQSDVALADLVPYPPRNGSAYLRRFFGFRRVAGAWKVVWQARYAKLTSRQLAAAMPMASTELLARLKYGLPVPDQTDTAALKASAEAAALKIAKANGGAAVGNLKAAGTRLAKDNGGTWWASVVVSSDKTGIDSLSVYLKRGGNAWTSVDLGTGIDPATDPRFPAEVRSKL